MKSEIWQRAQPNDSFGVGSVSIGSFVLEIWLLEILTLIFWAQGRTKGQSSIVKFQTVTQWGYVFWLCVDMSSWYRNILVDGQNKNKNV